MSDTQETTSPPKPRRRWGRRLLKLCVGVLIGLVLVIVGVQIFLWSGYPKQIGINVAQKITGLRVEMGTLTIGWFGDTTITDLAVSLPLEDRAFLTVPRVRVKHTSLVGILLTQDVVIRDAQVERPRVELRQDNRGAWNLQQALNQIGGPAQNVATGEPDQRGAGNIHLPDVDLTDAVVNVTARDGRSVELHGLTLNATNDGSLAWRFKAKVGTLADVFGSVTPAGRWPHDMQVNIEPALLAQLKPIIGDVANKYVVRLNADWYGERTATGVTGRLTIPNDGAQAGPVRANGATAITLDGGGVEVKPAGMKIDIAGLPTVELAGGRVQYGGTKVTADQLRVRFADGSVRLDAAGDLDTQQAHVDASWERVAFPSTTQHQGRFVLDIANIWPGKPQVSASIEARGNAVGRSFDTQVRVSGGGPRWSDAQYEITLPRVQVSRDRGISAAIEGAKITLHNTPDALELSSVQIPDRPHPPHAELHGALAFAGERQGAWWVWSSLQADAQAKVDYRAHLNAFGDGGGVTLAGAYGAIGTDVWANVTGRYRFDDPEPVLLQVDLEADPTAAIDEARQQLRMTGRLGASANLAGTLQPLNLRLAGHARSRKFTFRQFDLGNSDVAFDGVMLSDYVNVETSHLNLFGGEGWIAVKYPYFTDDLLAQITLDRMNMKQLGEAVGAKGIEGNVGGKFAFNVPLKSPRSLRGGGEVTLDRFAVIPFLAAQRVQIPIQVRDEWVQARPEATQEKGGRALIEVTTTFAEPTRVSVQASLTDWLTVLPLRDLYTRTGGSIDVKADLARQSAVGSIALDSIFGAHESEIGNTSLVLGLDNRTATLERLTGQVLGGTIFGQATVNIDEIERARLSIGATGLSLDRLAQLAPQVGDVKGNLSVRLHAEPAREARPLGPIEARFTVDSDRATYNGVEIGNTRVRAFVDRDRVVLSDDPQEPNRIAIAGGSVRLWGRLSGVPIDAATTQPSVSNARQQPSVFVQLRPEGLDIEQLNRIADPSGKPVPGRVSGEITAFGNPFDYRAISADGRLAVTQSDFANVGIFAVLYDAMRLGLSAGEPIGYGELSFRLQAGRLVVPVFSYFNRSVYATAALTLDDVFWLRASPIKGYIIGTFRPLKDLELPFLADLDKIGDALQRNATTLALDGTAGKVKAVPSSLKAFGSDFRNLLLGQTQRQQ